MQAPLGTHITCLPNITFNGHPAFAGPAVTFPLYDFHIDATCCAQRSQGQTCTLSPDACVIPPPRRAVFSAPSAKKMVETDGIEPTT